MWVDTRVRIYFVFLSDFILDILVRGKVEIH
jgi:hypothetical protein